jgi:tetratricopeptide (TPR) repeat protein
VSCWSSWHTLAVTSKSKQAGNIRIVSVERRPASADDRALTKADAHLRVAELKRREKRSKALAQCVQEAEAAKALLPREHERQRAVLAFLGSCHRDLDHHEEARAAFLESVALAPLHWARGEFREAVALQEQAAEIYARSGRKSGEGYARGNAGTLHAELGHSERAARCFEAAIA